MRPALPLRPGFLARLAAARELGRRFLLAGNLPEAIGAPPEEFEGHHPYVPGEDVRWIDWNLAARQDEFFVKVFRTDEEVETILLVDASGSMTDGEGVKYAAAAAAADSPGSRCSAAPRCGCACTRTGCSPPPGRGATRKGWRPCRAGWPTRPARARGPTSPGRST